MPIYEYVCQDCGTKFEKLIRRNGDAIACPSCGQSHLTTALSTFAAPSTGKAKSSEFPSCPGGMCQTPDLCGQLSPPASLVPCRISALWLDKCKLTSVSGSAIV